MDMYTRKQTNPREANRIHKDEVKELYKGRGSHKISLNDQLENFYTKCKYQRLFHHEIAYFFHAEQLEVDELEEYQKKFFELESNRFKRKTLLLKQRNPHHDRNIKSAKKYDSLEKIYHRNISISKNSEYRLYGGVRATLVFHLKWSPPNNNDLQALCERIQPMLFTQLWRKWTPINLPETTEDINVIGFNNIEDYNNEHYYVDDYDMAFPPLSTANSMTQEKRGAMSYAAILHK